MAFSWTYEDKISSADLWKKAFYSIWTYRLVRAFFAVVFVGSGIAKLADPGAFAVIVGAYGLMPDPMVDPVSVFLPVIEVLAGLGLLFDIRGSLEAITGMMLLFMGVLGYGIWLGLDIDCGCFGAGDPEADAFYGMRAALVRDAAMLAGIFYLYFWRRVSGRGSVNLASRFNS